MGDDTQIQDEGKSSIKLEDGVFKNVLYVPSLAPNMLYVYYMTHTGSPKWVLFGLGSLDILDISTMKLITKGVSNHASKAYEFSHFMPYSDPVHSQLPFERYGKLIHLNLLHMIMFPLMFQIQNTKHRIKLNQFMELKMKFNQIQIQI